MSVLLEESSSGPPDIDDVKCVDNYTTEAVCAINTTDDSSVLMNPITANRMKPHLRTSEPAFVSTWTPKAALQPLIDDAVWP